MVLMADVVDATDTQIGSAHTGPNAAEPPKTPTISRVPILHVTPENPKYDDKATVQARIDDFISILKPQIRDFLSKPRLSTWLPPESVDDETRQFYNNLTVPLVNKKPSLLLHNLGVTPNSNVDNLFQGQKHR